jgi:hypothetical protein
LPERTKPFSTPWNLGSFQVSTEEKLVMFIVSLVAMLELCIILAGNATGTAPDVVPPRSSLQTSDPSRDLIKAGHQHPCDLRGKVPALAGSRSIGQQASEGSGGNPNGTCVAAGGLQ